MTALVMLVLLVQIYAYAPAYMAEHTHQSLWIPLLLSIALSAIVGWTMLIVSEHYPNESFVSVLHKVIGKFLGNIVAGLYFIYFFILFIIHSQMIVTTFKTLFLPRTPMSAILLLVLILALYCSFLGIEVLARASNMVLILLLATILLLIFSVIPEIDPSYYKPIFPQSSDGLLYSTLISFSNYGQIVLLSTIFPFVNHQKEKRKRSKVFGGILFSCFLTSMVLVVEIGVFSPFELQRLQYPTVELITLIQIGEFMERMEIFLVTIWAGAMLLVIGIFFTVSCLTMTHMLKKPKESKALNILLIMIGFASILQFVPDTTNLITFIYGQWVYLSLIFHAVLPVLIGLFFFIRIKVMKHGKS